MAVRDFIHGVVDVICDFFLAVWDTIVDLVKAAVRFVGRAYDFFQKLFKKTWKAIKTGANKLYIFFFNPEVTDSGEKNVRELMERMIEAERQKGNVPIAGGILNPLPCLAASYNEDSTKVEEVNSFYPEINSKDQGMQNIMKEAAKGKKAVTMIQGV